MVRRWRYNQGRDREEVADALPWPSWAKRRAGASYSRSGTAAVAEPEPPVPSPCAGSGHCGRMHP